MDRKSQEQQEVQRLTALAAAARDRLGMDVASLRQKLDVPSRVRHSLSKHPTSWLAGSLVSGLAASLMFRRRPASVKKHPGFSSGLWGLTLTAARPLVKVWLAGLVKKWATEALSASPRPTINEALQHLSPSPSSIPAHVHSPGPRSR